MEWVQSCRGVLQEAIECSIKKRFKMKTLTINQMSSVCGGKGDPRDFVDGFLCAYGLCTWETGVGLLVAAWGCGRTFGII